MNPYSIGAYPSRDLAQYFEGTDVKFSDDNSVERCGTILQIGSSEDTCTIQCGRRIHRVRFNSILWDGVPEPQIVVYRNHPYLAAPIGIHTHKKGLTRDSVMCMKMDRNGGNMVFHEHVTDAQHEGVYNKYTSLPAPINVSTMIASAADTIHTRNRWFQFGIRAAVQFYGDSCFLVHDQGKSVEFFECNVTRLTPEFIQSLVICAYGVDNALQIED